MAAGEADAFLASLQAEVSLSALQASASFQVYL